MTELASALDSISPTNGATGVVLKSTVRIIFDREMDESSIEHGGFILEGPDTDVLLSHDLGSSTISPGSESGLLESPGYTGVVPGVFSFKRLELTTANSVDTLDTIGDGSLYRTEMTFTPDSPLKKNSSYNIYLVGEAIKPRTVFDGIADPSNIGDGEVTFSGSYTGDIASDTINVRITKSGVAGIAQYEWWKDSSILDVEGPVLTSRNVLQITEGVCVQFLDGDFFVGDEFSVVVEARDPFTGIYTASFETGAGSIQPVPTTTATSPIGNPVLATEEEFYVKKITPSDGSSNLSSEKYRTITVEFSDNIDPDTVTQDSVHVLAEAVTDHPNLKISSPNGEVAKTLTVSGNKLTITL